jgi:ubiquinone/menaquinone biosynthesis C-methylase UbiE
VSSQEEFWKIRAEKYNNLSWVNDDAYLKAFIRAGEFNKDDIVLDVGTGTGIVAHSIAPLVKEVIGLDTSQDMLEHSNWKENKYFIKRDIRNKMFHEGVFDKVTARMVFHHILEDTQKAMDECHRLLKKGGRIIVSEGVPPSKNLKKEYIDIFKLKEDRLVFLEEDLVELLKNSGFKNIRVNIHINRNFSVRNWLENSGLPKETQSRIFNMHANGSEIFKKEYNLRIADGDCLIDVKNLILIGEK